MIALTAALGLTVLACSRSSTARSPESGTGLALLALGDSYTIGEGVMEAGRWPVQLAELMRARGIEVRSPQIVARTGWTTDELATAVDGAAPQGHYPLVTLQIGVNNQYRGRSVDEYRREFQALLERAVGFAGGSPRRVLVLSIPDWGVTPFAAGRDRARIAAEIDQFNAVNRAVTLQAGAHYVDITPVSRTRGTEPAMVAPDGLHPSAQMYAEWARLALPAALEAVATP